jgi:transposase
METTAKQGELFPRRGAPEGTTFINERCLLRKQDGRGIVLVAGVALAQYSLGDRMAEAHAMVSLVDQGWADQNDVARAFGCSVRSLRRRQRRFEEGGLAALGHERGYPKGRPRLPESRTRQVLRLKGRGLSNRETATCLGVTENAVRKVLRRIEWKAVGPVQVQFPLESSAPGELDPRPSRGQPPLEKASKGAHPKLSAFASTDPPLLPSMDSDPSNRSLDRLLACLGLLDDASPVFRPGERIPGAGVLLAIPALVASGAIDCAREVYGSIGPAFYGLRTTIVALVLMALLRIRRPEELKEHPPEALGRILGLDRGPEVKTLRRKLARLAAAGRAARFGRALAERRVAARGSTMGFLYVDGHVRVYHGKETLPKAHVARMRLSLPATTDYWVNDAEGEPLFVVTAEANAGLVRMLPPILDQVRGLVGERRLTVVFDRGGWSPKLFAKLLAGGFDLLTYRKGRFRRVARSLFREHKGEVGGCTVAYFLADQGVRLLV